MIDSFRFENFWLNKYYNRPVYYKDIWFKSNHVAICYEMCKDRSDYVKKVFSYCDNVHANINLNKIGIREDWDTVKNEIVLKVTASRFFQNDDLKEKLLATEGKELIYSNNVDEHYWGVCNGVGKNTYGKILMEIRDYLKEEMKNGR